MPTPPEHSNGINFMGESKIIGPDGLDINNANEDEKVIVGEINTAEISSVRKNCPILRTREHSINFIWTQR